MLFLNQEDLDIHKYVSEPSTGLCRNVVMRLTPRSLPMFGVSETRDMKRLFNHEIQLAASRYGSWLIWMCDSAFCLSMYSRAPVDVDAAPQPAVEHVEKKLEVVQDDR